MAGCEETVRDKQEATVMEEGLLLFIPMVVNLLHLGQQHNWIHCILPRQMAQRRVVPTDERRLSRIRRYLLLRLLLCHLVEMESAVTAKPIMKNHSNIPRMKFWGFGSRMRLN
jgi:hypothetical protein